MIVEEGLGDGKENGAAHHLCQHNPVKADEIVFESESVLCNNKEGQVEEA